MTISYVFIAEDETPAHVISARGYDNIVVVTDEGI